MKKFLLTLLCLLAVSAAAVADTKTQEISFSLNSTSAGTDPVSVTLSEEVKYVNPYRWYANVTMTIEIKGGILKSITYTPNGKYNWSNTKADSGMISNISEQEGDKIWTPKEGEETSKVTITNGSSSQIRVSKMVVEYEITEIATQCSTPKAMIGNKSYTENMRISEGDELSFSCSTEGATIKYTIIGGDYEIEDAVYDQPIVLNQIGEYLVEAYAEKEGLDKSEALNIEFTVVEKKGTFSNPYSVADVIDGNNTLGNDIWVRGFIIGDVNGNKLRTSSCADTNIALADSKDGHSSGDAFDANGGFIPVQLSSKAANARAALNAADNIGMEVMICGNSEAYFSTTGIKGDNLKYIFFTKAPEVPAIVDQDFINHDAKEIKISEKKTIKLSVGEAVNIWYKLESNSDNNGSDSVDLEGESSEHSHEGYTLYDDTKGIELTPDHTSLSFFSCNPITQEHHAEEPVTYAVLDIASGVLEIEAVGVEARWFDLQGREVVKPAGGLYIRVAGGKAEKVIVK